MVFPTHKLLVSLLFTFDNSKVIGEKVKRNIYIQIYGYVTAIKVSEITLVPSQ